MNANNGAGIPQKNLALCKRWQSLKSKSVFAELGAKACGQLMRPIMRPIMRIEDRRLQTDWRRLHVRLSFLLDAW